MTRQTDNPQGDSPVVEDSPSASKPRRRTRSTSRKKDTPPAVDTTAIPSQTVDSSPRQPDDALSGPTGEPAVNANNDTPAAKSPKPAKPGKAGASRQTSARTTTSRTTTSRRSSPRKNTATANTATEAPVLSGADEAPSVTADALATAPAQKRAARPGRGKRKDAPTEDNASPSPLEATDNKADSGASDTAAEAAPAHTSEGSAHPRTEAGESSHGDDGDNAEGDQPDPTDAEEAPRRKSRRGRRGGRGRNRKSKTSQGEAGGEEGNASGSAPALEAPLSEDAPQPEEAALPAPESTEQASAPKPGGRGRRSKKAATEVIPDADSQAAATEGEPSVKGKKSKATPGNKRMYISVLPGEQVEVALTEENMLVEYYLDMLHQRKIKGNIYKGVIHNIDTNLQAAFVSYGEGKNGFLQIDEVHPEYWQSHHEVSKGKKFPPIQKALKAGQEVLVQVVKEPTGSKGAFLTTWLSLAGRFLVLTPGQEQIGVSRKVESDEERNRLREMMNGIDPGQGLGVIVRTVSAGTTKTTLKNDLQYLKRLWRDIRKKATENPAPSLIHQEPGLSERAVRDYLTDDVAEIWVDNESVAETIRETVNLLFPRKKDLVRLHTDVRQSLWERFGLRRQLEQIYSREVVLPSGGRLVFDQTEALMAIDINSGKISGKGNFEAMSFKTNMEAAEGIARQLRLRDIGGQVVIDFIEMRDRKHVAEVEKTLRQAMRNDRARHDVGHMSSFGLLELVRQRMGSSALAISLEPCPACGGTGQRRNLEWQALQSLRELRRLLRSSNGGKCVFEATPELGLYLLNHKRDTLRDMEQEFGKCLEIAIKP